MTDPRNVLVVQLGDIGDLVLSTPALAALREACTGTCITLLTTRHAAKTLEDTTLVDRIITFDRKQFNNSTAFFRPANLRQIFALRQYKFDTVIFFHHFTLRLGTLKFALIALAAGAKRRIGLQNGNGWFLTESLSDDGFGARHQAQYWLDLVGLLGVDSSPRPTQVSMGVPAPNLPHLHKPIVVIHPGSGGYSMARRWSPEKFAQVADALQTQHNAQIVIVGGRRDGGRTVIELMDSEAIDLVGKTSLPDLAATIATADLYIGADSGIMHLASATGTPVLAIFGPSNPHAWGPWTPTGQSVVLRSGVECSPCSYVEHGIGLRDGCAARTCMRLITPEQAITAATNLLHKKQVSMVTEHQIEPPLFWRTWGRAQILGLPVDGITYTELLQTLETWINAGDRCYHICTTNPEFTMIAQQDDNFRNILRRADLCIPDGMGLLWAAKRLGTPLPERVTGSDGVPCIAARAAERGWRLFFLGAAPGVADAAADTLREKHPGLQIVGVYSGSPSPEEEDAIVERVNASNADILFVAYGAPRQDKWIARNLPRLNVSMAMGVGGAFDFIAGLIPRAPMWMQQLGLEWLYRLYLQPWRIKRMMRLPRFVLAVLRRGAN